MLNIKSIIIYNNHTLNFKNTNNYIKTKNIIKVLN